MVAEQLIFTVIAFTIFVYMFFRMIKNNDTSYVIILTLEAIGIALNFIEVLFNVKLNTLFIILKYLFAILIPIVVIIIEKRDITLFELINISKAKMCILFGDEKKAKEILFKLIDKNKESYKGHLLLAQIYEQEGGMRKAIDEYVQAIALNKKDYESYYKVSKLLNDLDKKDEAAQMLNNLLNKKPDMLEASELLGDILIEKEMFKEKLQMLDLGLEDRMTSKVGLLSGGQRQALTLLMATLKKPSLLLLDEHTAALDPKTAKKVLDITEKIVARDNLTTMMVTHNMKDAINIGNRLIMMSDGKIIYDVKGEEKKKLKVADLLQKFEEASGGEFANDRMLLS